MVEKSEYRSHGAQAIGMLTSQMESTDYARFVKWLFNFSQHSKVKCLTGRLFISERNVLQTLHTDVCSFKMFVILYI